MKTRTQVREWNRKASRKYRRAHPERLRFIYSKRSFGVTKEMYDQRMAEQRSLCAICGDEFQKTPHIDHDHATMLFRGLLCQSCNHLLGNARDRIDVLIRAVEYLKKYGDSNGREKA
jgi:hypothetical protein